MGVADNRSYKDEYLFNDKNRSIFRNTGSTAADNPSINVDPKINSIIKENPYKSNVEIEGREVVLQPDLSALFNAIGKRHSQGGMDVMLKPNSFVFSDFEDLAISPAEHKLFELKEGGKKSTDTPADVLKRNVDIKHYNNLVNIMNDPHKDDLAKKSAALMLEKYIGTLGNIAYIQEKKKDFPTGLPSFSRGTAPVYDPTVKEDIESNKQYAKAGGKINPYLPKAQMGWNALHMQQAKQPTQPSGMWVFGKFVPSQKNPNDNQITPPIQNQQTAKLNNTPPNWGLWHGDKQSSFKNEYGISNAADKITNLDNIANQLGYTGPKDNKAFQQWLYNSSPENKAIIDKYHSQYGMPSAGVIFDGKIGIRWTNALGDILNQKIPPTPQRDTATIIPPSIEEVPNNPETPQSPTSPAAPVVPNVDGSAQGIKTASWQFTPWQKLSQAYNWGQWANVKRYMPYRSRFNATYADPALVNPEQAVGDAKSVGYQELNAQNSLNPILRNAQGAATAGQILNQIPGIRTQYDNQNAQIKNQFRQFNAQTQNNESMINMQNDQNYYQQATTARANFDNMRQYTANNAMNNTLRDAETNQKLAYNLLTQNNPAYGFDWKTGNFYRNPKSILDVQGNGVNDRYSDLLKTIQAIPDATERAKLMVKLEGLSIFKNAQQDSTPFKKGGTVKKKNPYK